MSTEIASSRPEVGAINAASSPIPSTAPRAGRRKKRSMTSNSLSAAIAAGPLVKGRRCGALDAGRADFRRARLRCELVEHTVDELVAVGAAIGFRQLDRLIDRHAVRHFGLVEQFPGADDQHAALDGRELR